MSAQQLLALQRLWASLSTPVAGGCRRTKDARSDSDTPDVVSQVGNLALSRLMQGAVSRSREAGQRDEQEADRTGDRIVSGQTGGLFLPGQLSEVRIHTSGPASEAARTMHVQAFALGNHVAFAPGRFDPATAAGRHLLGHELAHVAQQRTTGPHMQGKPDQPVPPYLWELESRLRPWADKQIRMWADETGPLDTLTSQFPQLPLREDVPIDIPYINPEHPPEFKLVEDRSVKEGFRVVGPPHGEFLLHSQLPGGYELIAYDPMKGRVLIGRSRIGYVLGDEMFAALFGEEGIISNMFEESEALPKLLHDKPWLPLVLDFSGYMLMIGMMMLDPELMAAFESVGPLTGELLEAETLVREIPAIFGGTAASGADMAAVSRIFEELGGQELGYTVRVCNESTTIETKTSFENVGQMAKNQGGAYTNTATKTVWIDESVVARGGITRAWGEELSTKQILAHELGHVKGGFNCSMASRAGADLPGLTAAERRGLLNDAVEIAPKERVTLDQLHLPPDFTPPTKK